MSQAKRDERLELTLVQLLSDEYFAAKSKDGTGFNFFSAPYARDWMDSSAKRFAYRCLPLTIANQSGYWLTNPVGFTAKWNGSLMPGSVQFDFDTGKDRWDDLISNLFGNGVITWNNPFLIRTRPLGSRVLLTGPANFFNPLAQALHAWIETDWLNATFTMNWKIVKPHVEVRFEQGEPIFQLLPVRENVLQTLEQAIVRLRTPTEEPELYREYQEWSKSRAAFQEQRQQGTTSEEWQRDYFLGRDGHDRPANTPLHQTKLKLPQIESGARLGLDVQVAAYKPGRQRDIAVQPQLKVTRTHRRARLPEAIDDCCLLWSPFEAEITWLGGTEFSCCFAKSVFNDADAGTRITKDGPVLLTGTDTGILTVSAALIAEAPAGYRLRIRGDVTPGDNWRIRETTATHGSVLVQLQFEFLQPHILTRIPLARIAKLELVPENFRIDVVECKSS